MQAVSIAVPTIHHASVSIPLLEQSELSATAVMAALAISATIVDVSPFSTLGATDVSSIPLAGLSDLPAGVQPRHPQRFDEVAAEIRRAGFSLSAKYSSEFNTGSDLLFGKEQDGYVVVNGRIGLTDIGGRFAVEGCSSRRALSFSTSPSAPSATTSTLPSTRFFA